MCYTFQVVCFVGNDQYPLMLKQSLIGNELPLSDLNNDDIHVSDAQENTHRSVIITRAKTFFRKYAKGSKWLLQNRSVLNLFMA